MSTAGIPQRETPGHAALVEQIRRIVVERLELGIEPSELDPDADLDADMGLDSAAMLELALGLEEHFEIDLELAEVAADDFRSVRALASLLASRL